MFIVHCANFRQSSAFHALGQQPISFPVAWTAKFYYWCTYLRIYLAMTFYVVEKTLCIHQTSQIFSNAVDLKHDVCYYFVVVAFFGPLWFGMLVGWIISFSCHSFFLMYYVLLCVFVRCNNKTGIFLLKLFTFQRAYVFKLNWMHILL